MDYRGGYAGRILVVDLTRARPRPGRWTRRWQGALSAAVV